MKTIGSLGLIRGLIALIIGTALGMGLAMFIRQLEGKPAWKDEPVIVIEDPWARAAIVIEEDSAGIARASQ